MSARSFIGLIILSLTYRALPSRILDTSWPRHRRSSTQFCELKLHDDGRDLKLLPTKQTLRPSMDSLIARTQSLV
nr:hypothetical protein CFP56_36688 [Quercus suber]